jgi:hypothetical protein
MPDEDNDHCDAPKDGSRAPDWMPELDYWVADDASHPEIPFPENWEVCGVPDYEPFQTAAGQKRHGRKYMGWPMYSVADPVSAIDIVCSILEQMNPEAMDAWYALPDRFLRVSCGDSEMDAADLDSRGFSIPAEIIRRVRHLRLRVQVTFHPHAKVRFENGY